MDRLKNKNLLFLEDNEEFAKNTIEFLNNFFKKIYYSCDIKSALEIVDDNKIDCMIVDVRLKDGNGLEFIKKLREENNMTPAIVLSAYKDEELLLKAIPLNILSYEIKPLNYDGFMNLLEKISHSLQVKDFYKISEKITYDYKSKVLLDGSNEVGLTKKEIIFLEFMMKKSPEIITYEMLQINVYEEEFMSPSAIKNLILRLRRKVSHKFIASVAGVGYKFI